MIPMISHVRLCGCVAIAAASHATDGKNEEDSGQRGEDVLGGHELLISSRPEVAVAAMRERSC